jgi:hypothetical protein
VAAVGIGVAGVSDVIPKILWPDVVTVARIPSGSIRIAFEQAVPIAGAVVAAVIEQAGGAAGGGSVGAAATTVRASGMCMRAGGGGDEDGEGYRGEYLLH